LILKSHEERGCKALRYVQAIQSLVL